MTGKEYLEIMEYEGFYRSTHVRLLEKQVQIFEKNGMHDHAEETKWLIFEYADLEKQLGIDFMEVDE